MDTWCTTRRNMWAGEMVPRVGTLAVQVGFYTVYTSAKKPNVVYVRRRANHMCMCVGTGDSLGAHRPDSLTYTLEKYLVSNKVEVVF